MKVRIPAMLAFVTALSFTAAAQSSKPDPEMKMVLDALASLGGKPIEKLSPTVARKQPTPADAVKKVLQQQGKSTAPEPVEKVDNRAISGQGGQIPIRIYWRRGTVRFPSFSTFMGAVG